MESKRVIAPFPLALLVASCLGIFAGCEAGSGQIPLANVPAPPEGFTANKNAVKVPGGASPTDANQRRK